MTSRIDNDRSTTTTPTDDGMIESPNIIIGHAELQNAFPGISKLVMDPFHNK
jgi:hypothetical protein